jgi:hypothetical protein
VSILGPESYPKFFSNLVSNSQSYLNLKFDSPLHYAAGSQKKIVVGRVLIHDSYDSHRTRILKVPHI